MRAWRVYDRTNELHCNQSKELFHSSASNSTRFVAASNRHLVFLSFFLSFFEPALPLFERLELWCMGFGPDNTIGSCQMAVNSS